MNIRRAQIEDILEIGDMWEAMKEENANEFYKKFMTGEEKRSFMHFLSNWILNNNFLIFVAEDKEKVGGFIFTELQTMEHGSSMTAFFDKIYVKPEFRNTRMAMQMIEHTKEMAKKMGAKLAEFTTNYTEADIKRWTKRGYKPVLVTFMKEL